MFILCSIIILLLFYFIPETSLPSTPRDSSKTPDSHLDLPDVPDILDLNLQTYTQKCIDSPRLTSPSASPPPILPEQKFNYPIKENANEFHKTVTEGNNIDSDPPELESTVKMKRNGSEDYDDSPIENDDPVESLDMKKTDFEFDDRIPELDLTVPTSLPLSSPSPPPDNNHEYLMYSEFNLDEQPVLEFLPDEADDIDVVPDLTEGSDDDFRRHNFGDDGSVLSLKLDPIRISVTNSPIENEHVGEIENSRVVDDIHDDDDNNSIRDIDNNDDDFNEFKELPVDDINPLAGPNCDLVLKNTEIYIPRRDVEPENVGFNADFSQFADFSSATTESTTPIILNSKIEFKQSSISTELDDGDFDDFQDFASSEVTTNNTKSTIEDNQNLLKVEDADNKNEDNKDDDNHLDDGEDDFGDFNDFSNAPAPYDHTKTLTSEQTVLPIILKPQVDSVLGNMFPKSNESEDSKTESSYQSEQQHLSKNLENSILFNLKDYESTKALKYQWMNSMSNQTLVQSLGIDARNIVSCLLFLIFFIFEYFLTFFSQLFGSKWNSSMPRFAANLAISPLEPLKPSIPAVLKPQAVTSNQSTVENDASLPSVPMIGDVPAALFDWNSAGLVNPLDGESFLIYFRC